MPLLTLVVCVSIHTFFSLSAIELAWAQEPVSDSTIQQSLPKRVELRGEWFYVDGEPFLIKGIGYSPARPGQIPWKQPPNLEWVEDDFQRIVEAGFNTLRTWAPLSPELLRLADQHGLMVLQGIWLERSANYTSGAFQEASLDQLREKVTEAMPHSNILAFLIGNELLPKEVFEAGIPQTEAFLQTLFQGVKALGPTRFVSYANWPSLSFLNQAMADAVCFNLYPYEPVSVSHTFGFRSYVEYLKESLAFNKPLVVTEIGLSVSPKAGDRPGYGGNTQKAQQDELMGLWDDLFQANAQGGVVFEWNDEWWKQGENNADENVHDAEDPEEWFGLIQFSDREDKRGQPRPVYESLKTYNQAILLSPLGGREYQQELPVTVYATEAVAFVRVHFGPRGWFGQKMWHPATKLSRHWWKAMIPVSARLKDGEYPLVMEALDRDRHLVVRHQRMIRIGPEHPRVHLSLVTDQEVYHATDTPESVRYTISVTDDQLRPVVGYPVFWSIAEPQTNHELTHSRLTDERGKVEGTYLVQDPGIVIVASATPRHPDSRDSLRTGTQKLLLVYSKSPLAPHEASAWEAAVPGEIQQALRHDPPAFELHDPGRERLVDYSRYGTFHNLGTDTYRYEVKDWQNLAAAVGEGIYPNEAGLLKDPAYQAAQQSNKLDGSHWDFTFHLDVALSFFKWAQTDEEPGVKQFYVALALERAGLWLQAVKAYYAVLVHFPKSIGWTAFDPPTPWYVGKVARDKIEAILRLHPELSMRLEGTQIIVQNGFDHDLQNDTIRVDPGRLLRVTSDSQATALTDRKPNRTVRVTGTGRVQLLQDDRTHWQLHVDGKPWTIQGLTYQPSQVGESPDEGTLRDWMRADRNGNGRIDAFDTFVDRNRNNRQDADEPIVGDFELIHAMGVNTLRLFHTNHPDTATTKALLRQLYERYGFMVLMGDFVGMYTVGSGARWEDGTDYLNVEQRSRMFEAVKQMVQEYKDEPYLLMWVLGNENNYGGVHGIVGGVGNAGRYPREYYQFINELAGWIHSVDPNHPVAVGNGDVLFLDLVAQAAPAIDVFGANSYRGWHGFGRTFFEEIKRMLDKPVLITEYGCPAYQRGQSGEVAQRDQALYHFGNWVDLADNMAGSGVGNVVGGVVFEWSDEWWKAGQPPAFSPKQQEVIPNWAGPFPGGWNFEEWFGLVGQGDGGNSPYLRQLRLSYRLYQALWGKGTVGEAK